MITENDIKQAKELKLLLEKQFLHTAEEEFNWDIANKIELIDRMVSNLQKAPFSYAPACAEDVHVHYYTAVCDKCGWWGSSKLLDGGGQIADTGDYGDTYCPVCGNTDTGEVDENEAEIEHQARRFITNFGKYAVDVINKMHDGGELYKPTEEKIHERVLEILQSENNSKKQQDSGGKIKNCRIVRYDESITKPPFLTKFVCDLKIIKPDNDNLGEDFALKLHAACADKGYKFQCYTTSIMDGFDYDILIY